MSRYITTTLPYVNAHPHLGFALELVQADALVRALRVRGEDVFFNTGTDEHGQKIFEAAKRAGEEVQAYADHYAEEFRKLPEALGLDTPHFIRTTDPRHIEAAQELWRRCAASGDIEMREYEGLYCVGHEAFITEKELVDGKCPDHGTVPERLKEKNYFFKFKNYEEKLLAYLERPGAIAPEWRRQEAIAFVKGGLEDFSISRERARHSWGIPVPGDDTQVMYVWFDALTNYISALGWPHEGEFKKYWIEGQTLQLAGKDQMRFQSLIWQAMLMSAGIKNTDQVFYHGFIISGGQKMSKSLGNVINPFEVVQKYGTDATRYFLLRHVHSFDDSDVTWDHLQEWYTANLVNGLGNFVARVMTMAEANIAPVALAPEDTRIEEGFLEKFDAFRFNEAVELIWEHVAKGDGYMTAEEPYKKIKSALAPEQEEAKQVVEKLVRHLAKLAAHLAPVMPHTSEKIMAAVRANKKPENLFPRL